MPTSKSKKVKYDHTNYLKKKESRARAIKKYDASHKKEKHIYNKKCYKRFMDYKRTLSCVVCNLSGLKYPQILHFHHRDPTTKLFRIPDKARQYPSKALMDEIAKCDVLCANCHGIAHVKLLEES